MNLNLSSNIEKSDDFYQKLIDMQRDLSDEQVQLANAKLLLLLANHIGDETVLIQAIDIAQAQT